MKISIIFLVVFGTVLATPLPKHIDPTVFSVASVSKDDRKITIQLTEEFVKEFSEDVKNKSKGELVDVINEYVDKVFENLKKFIIHHGLDPYEMPEIHEVFHFMLLKGHLDLTTGWLQDVSTLHRIKDATISYSPDDSNILHVVIPMGFNTLQFIYDYEAKFMGLGPRGALEGKITDLQLQVALAFDLNNYQAHLDRFDILHSGHIDLNFSGNVLTDWILNLFIDVATTALHGVILLIMQTLVRNPIESIIEAVNQLINNILHPDTTTQIILNYRN